MLPKLDLKRRRAAGRKFSLSQVSFVLVCVFRLNTLS